MKRGIWGSIGFACALAATPLAAQDETVDEPSTELTDMDQMLAGMAALYPAEPLTPEQEARLPAAEALVALVVPEGTVGEIFGKMMDDMVTPTMEMGPSPAKTTVAKALGVTTFELDITDEQAVELASLFDPAWEERHQRELALFPDMMREMFTLIEPSMRKAMSELYAIRFSDSELAEIGAFFATPTGERYARESFAMASDPRMMSASMEMLPAMMGSLGDIEARMAESTADLPETRGFDDLTDAERAQVSEATGISEELIREFLAQPDVWESEWGEPSPEAIVEAE